MASSTSPLVFLFFSLLFTSTSCFNITKLLGTYPDYSNFNDYLTQTQLSSEINNRRTITVLAVPNSAMSPVSGKPSDYIKKVMSLHVVLDYYDVPKLQKLSNKTAILTTLFQATGMATGQQGFLNVTDMTNGNIMFGSAEKGSSLTSQLVKLVAAQPYNISVLQVSALVIPPGIENSNSSGHGNATAPPPHSAAPPSHAPKTAPAPKNAPPPKKVPVPKSAPAPSPDEVAPAADAPAADAPAKGKAPASSPPKPAADGPVADGPAGADGAGAPADEPKSSGERVALGSFGAAVLVAVSSWLAL